MEPTWLYVGIALVTIVSAILFRKLVGDKTIRHRIAAWILILFGVAVLILAAFETGHDLFFVAAGVMFVAGGIVDLFAWPKQTGGTSPSN